MGRTVAALLVSMLLSLPPAWAGDDRGWGYLIDKLTADGLDREQVARVFADPRVPPFTGLGFSPQQPREARSEYRHFLRAATIARARLCRLRNGDAFEAAERLSSVPASVLAAILFVESGCGGNTGSHVILPRLARLAMANEPENLQRNLARFAAADGSLDAATEAGLRARARYLEDTFYPEVRATFAVASRMGVQPLDIRGSPSGAFGYPQFLPTSYLRYGEDGDGDGQVSLYDTADAAASAARYLEEHGWHVGLTPAQRHAAIWQYNHSDAYIETVLTLAARIDGVPAGTHSVAARPRRARARTVAADRQHRKRRARVG